MESKDVLKMLVDRMKVQKMTKRTRKKIKKIFKLILKEATEEQALKILYALGKLAKEELDNDKQGSTE